VHLSHAIVGQEDAILFIPSILICFQLIWSKAEVGILEINLPEYKAYPKKVLWIGRNPFTTG
jgi:hypothetical protein